jgi:hypothetical protein
MLGLDGEHTPCRKQRITVTGGAAIRPGGGRTIKQLHSMLGTCLGEVVRIGQRGEMDFFRRAVGDAVFDGEPHVLLGVLGFVEHDREQRRATLDERGPVLCGARLPQRCPEIRDHFRRRAGAIVVPLRGLP